MLGVYLKFQRRNLFYKKISYALGCKFSWKRLWLNIFASGKAWNLHQLIQKSVLIMYITFLKYWPTRWGALIAGRILERNVENAAKVYISIFVSKCIIKGRNFKYFYEHSDCLLREVDSFHFCISTTSWNDLLMILIPTFKIHEVFFVYILYEFRAAPQWFF